MTEERREAAPLTAGELRQRLAELGNPWTVDPRLGDDEPLPEHGRGGELPEQVPAERRAPVAAEADLAETLRQQPPSNPFLRARWAELGLLPTEEAGPPPAAGGPPDEAAEPPDDRREDQG